MGVCLICSALVGAWPARVTPRLRRPARVTPRLRRPARVTPRLRRPARVTPRLRRPARVTPRLRRPARVTPRLRRPARVTPRLRRPARVTSRLRRPARVTSRLRRPARVTSRLRRPARVTSRLRRPARVTSRLRRPARVTSRLRRPARVTSRHSSLPSVTSRLCCLLRPALVGSCLIGPTWTWPSVPSPGSTSAPPPSWSMLCVSVWKPLFGGGLCHESGYHSPKLHITHGLHLPACTALTHSRPPLHQSHSCHHSLINPDCLTTPAPHSLTHIKAAHKHSLTAKSCFALATFLSVLPRICYLCVWPRTAWPWTSEPVPVTSTLAWYCLRLCSASDLPVFACWPLPVWFCPRLINIGAIGSACLRPLPYNHTYIVSIQYIIQHSHTLPVPNLHFTLALSNSTK